MVRSSMMVEPLWSSEWLAEVQSAWETTLGRNVSNSDSNKKNSESPLYQCLQEHIQQHYTSRGVKAHISLLEESDDTGFTLFLYAERIQLPSSHVANWMGHYTFHNQGDNLNLSGQIQCRGHVFESGTVQSHYTSKPFYETIIKSSPNVEYGVIVSLIEKWEEEVWEELQALYGELSGSILKQVRRILPVTRTKMDWNVQAVKLVQSMEEDVSRRDS